MPGYEAEDKPLILQKTLGHPEIPNSKNWKIKKDCWMCEKYNYTQIFWDARLGQKFQIQQSFIEEIVQKLVMRSTGKFFSYYKSLRDVETKYVEPGTTSAQGRAFISGTFTDWKPKKMLRIDELCAILMGDTKVLKDEG